MAHGQRAGRAALIEPGTVSLIGLNAAPVGTSDDSVLRWLVAGTTISGAYYTAPDSATLGTVVTVTTPGTYRAEMGLMQVASTTILMGIAVGTTTGVFTGNPVIGANGVIATLGPNTLPAATLIGSYLGVSFDVGDADLNGTLNTVRFLCTDGAGGTPIAGLTEADCWARVTRVADKAA